MPTTTTRIADPKKIISDLEPPKKRGPGRPRKTETSAPEKTEAITPPLSTLAIKATGAVTMSPSETKVEPKVEIWMGTTDECPYWTVHAGGADFPRFNEKIETDLETGTTRRERHRGKVTKMTRSEIELVARAVGRKVVRKAGARAFILNIGSDKYRHNPIDKPLGKFVYIQVLSENLPHDWRSRTPETMA
jgi:hypothetical protein